MKITVEEALIRTATVEIKSLTVSGRQVTLAVFRQLDQSNLIDYDLLKLNGVVWGRVNYHPDCDHTSAKHVHLIWQSGTELKRDCVSFNDACGRKEDHNIAYEDAFFNLVMVNSLDKHVYWNIEYVGNKKQLFDVGGIRNYVQTEGELDSLLSANRDRQNTPGKIITWGEFKDKNCEEVAAILESRLRAKYSLSYDAAYEAVTRIAKERTAYTKDWNTLYSKLETVQQLFIAV